MVAGYDPGSPIAKLPQAREMLRKIMSSLSGAFAVLRLMLVVLLPIALAAFLLPGVFGVRAILHVELRSRGEKLNPKSIRTGSKASSRVSQ